MVSQHQYSFPFSYIFIYTNIAIWEVFIFEILFIVYTIVLNKLQSFDPVEVLDCQEICIVD